MPRKVPPRETNPWMAERDATWDKRNESTKLNEQHRLQKYIPGLFRRLAETNGKIELG